MKETSCNVIRDLLPLYEDGAVSEETADLVRSHLKDCPACREELRKMRTPISLPPEEDEDLWKKFAEKKERLRRKRIVKAGCLLSVLAVLVVLYLWYTRPRTWAEITGENVSVQFASLTMADPDWDADTAIEKLGYKHWQLRQEDPSLDEVNDAILQALGRYSFRASLDSLIPRDGISMGWRDDITVHMAWGENRRFFYFGDTGAIISPGGWGYDIYHADPRLFDELAEILRAYGTLQED